MTISDKPQDSSNIFSDESSKDLQNATIMIVDDESITMDVVEAYLEDFGYNKFVQVDQSSEAMGILEIVEPDILLLDLVMPEVSGFDILALVRKHAKFRHLPVIILTASSDPDSKLKALDLGATDFLAKPVDQSELGLRVRNTLAAKAYVDQLAFYDPLTKLPNKLMFRDRYDWSLKRAQRYGEKLALFNISLDDFDKINATVGLPFGDDVLCIIAQRISEVIRNVDLVGRSVSNDDNNPINLFRVEGAVFSLLLDRIKSTKCAALVAERVLQVIGEPIPFEESNIYPTVSIGIATYPDEGHDSISLQRLAASAKDYARSKGGNSFQFSSASINETYEKRFRLESKLRKAIEKQQLVLHYQPKVNVQTGAIEAVEALLRWNDGANGLVPPNDFIPLAEDTGLIIPFGEWVLQEACAQLTKWNLAGKIPLSMAVNLSIKQFSDPDFLKNVTRIIQNSGIDPQFLKLEITESLLLDDLDTKIGILHQLKDLGVKLSIDDFGTGYSSLSYLTKLPVDELKIDRSFIIDVADDKDSQAIVSSVIFLSHSLELLTVAEGIETEEQLNFLKKEGCDQYQGFFFSRPLPADQLTDILPDM